MNILILGPYRKKIVDYLVSIGDSPQFFEDSININSDMLNNVDFLVSYGYRHILNDEILEIFIEKAINIHISLLPWNRGADPNLWSFLEDTPKGVSIHYIDSGIDTGKIIIQDEIKFLEQETLRSSYLKLSNLAERLFIDNWIRIKNERVKSKIQKMGGSFHRSSDKHKYDHLLVQGWDTPVSKIVGKAL